MKKTNVAYVMGLAGLLVASSGWADEPAASALPNDIAVAQSLYDDGKEAIKAGDWSKAQLLFRESLKKAEWTKTGAQLGRVLIEQGEYVEGANYLEWFFREDKEVPPDVKEKVRLTLNIATPHVVALKLVVEPADAVVHIDDKLIEVHRFGWTHYVAAAKEHTFRAEKKGFDTAIQKKSFAAGVTDTIALTLVPAKEEAKGPVKVEGPKVPVQQPYPTKLKAAWIAGGALAGVALGTGIAAGYTYSKMVDAWELEGCENKDTCWTDEFEPRRTAVVALSVTSSIAIAAGLGALGYAMYGTFGKPQNQVSVRVVPTTNGAMVMGTF